MSDLLRILNGDALEMLRSLPSESVQCVVTSPPYWRLRDYGTGRWIGGDPSCDHREGRQTNRCENLIQQNNRGSNPTTWNVCGKCGAVREDKQIGLEPTFWAFLARLVEVFEEVRRVLKKDGTCWVNMGDSMNGAGLSGGTSAAENTGTLVYRGAIGSGATSFPGLKRKQLIGQPWRLAFALQAAGWYLRADIIWHKPNPMPESVRDRPTKAHEYIFLLSKSERYFYDADAIREPVTGNAHPRGDGVNPKARYKTPDGWDTSSGQGGHGSIHRQGREKGKTPGKNSRVNVAHVGNAPQSRQNESFSAAVRGLVDDRNKRSVWTVPTFPCPDAHFATFPPDLVKPCILAGSRPGDVILDPFGGSGTTGEVAIELGRKAVLIELNPEYCELIKARCRVTPGLPL